MSHFKGPISNMKFILGRKLQMSQIYRPDGTVVPVTLVEAGPCVVTQVKTSENDGYRSVQVGFDPCKNLNQPQKNHLKDLPPFGVLREFCIDEKAQFNRGDEIAASVFAPGDAISVSGVSKGRGFQGVVKRHGFHGQKTTHGHKDQERAPGSIGAGGIQRVFKGMKMAGHMGQDRVTVKNLEIVEVRGHILAIKGAVPGARHSVVEIVSQ